MSLALSLPCLNYSQADSLRLLPRPSAILHMTMWQGCTSCSLKLPEDYLSPLLRPPPGALRRGATSCDTCWRFIRDWGERRLNGIHWFIVIAEHFFFSTPFYFFYFYREFIHSWQTQAIRESIRKCTSMLFMCLPGELICSWGRKKSRKQTLLI